MRAGQILFEAGGGTGPLAFDYVSNRTTKTKLIPAFFVTSMACLATMVLIARLRAPHYLTSEEFHDDGKAMTGQWADQPYLPLADKTFEANLGLAVANAPGGGQLDDEQRADLRRELTVFFRAYSAGNYAAFSDFHFPPGVAFAWKTNKYGSIDEVLKKPPGFGGRKSYDRWFYNIHQAGVRFDALPAAEKYQMYLKLFSGDTLYSNYLTAVCFDHSRLVIKDFTNGILNPWQTQFWPRNSLPTNSLTIAAPFPNQGYFSQKSNYCLVAFKDSPQSLQNEFGRVLVADGCFLVQRPAPDTCLPLIVRFYWHPRLQRWLPDDLVVCSVWSVDKDDYWPLF